MTTARHCLLAAALLGCGDSDGSPAPGDDTTSTSGGSEATSTPSTSTATTEPPGSEASTAEPGSTGAADSSSSTAAPEQACGLEDLSPGTPDPIQSGTGAMQVPPDIATILVASCGCHLSNDLIAGAPNYAGGFDMSTWDGFQAVREFDSMPYFTIGLDYLSTDFMPLQSFCNVDGEAMDPDDRATLIQWLTEDAPDGATWVP